MLGYDVRVSKAAPNLSPVSAWPGAGLSGWPIVREPYAGAWQNNAEAPFDTVIAHYAVYACVTLIANDIGKLRPRLLRLDADGIWSETTSPAYSPVLRKPNRYQTRIQFIEWYVTSKLLRGNAYALKERDNRGVVVAEYVLHPDRVVPLVAPDGAVYYQLQADNLAGLENGGVIVPASEIIHDRMNCLFHPLVGTSPLYAAGLAATQGIKIQRDSTAFFGNSAAPGGVLTAPGAIGQETADRLKAHWESGYTGSNAGRVAVLGDGLKFEPMRMTATDSQMVEQLRFTAEAICSVFHVPGYKINVGAPPAYNNIESLAQEYYNTGLQTHIENYEVCQDEGLRLPEDMGVDLDLSGLLRMDTATQMTSIVAGIGGGVLTPNEGRKKLNLPKLVGGDTVYLQQQQFGIAALAKRDAADPFAKPAPVAAVPATEPAAKSFDGPPLDAGRVSSAMSKVMAAHAH